MSQEKREVLILDERSDSLIHLFELVDREGFDTTGVSSQKEALSVVARRKPDIFIDHLRNPSREGMSFLNRARLLSPGTRIILLSSSAPGSVVPEAADLEGKVEWIPEPCPESELLDVLERGVQAIPGK